MSEQNSQFDNFEMQLTSSSKEYLESAGKWALILGIIGFVFSGLMLIASVFVGIAFSSFSPDDFGGAFGASMPFGGGTIAAIYVVLALLYGAFSYFLFNFGMKMKQANQKNDGAVLEKSLHSLKLFFKIWGIMTIVFLGMYVIMIFSMVVFS
jgi:hypothetical protein